MKKILTAFLIICLLFCSTVYAKGSDVAKVPVLMYHSVGDGENDVIISAENFRSHLEVIRDNGFTPVSLSDLINFVDNGEELPQKPVLITFDDGYSDNYLNAFPILSEFGFKATVFVIGSSVGKLTYKDTEIPINPHFDYSEAKEMYDSGLISIQSHSHDMHQSQNAENTDFARVNVLPFENESLLSYIKAFEKDFLTSKNNIEENVGNKVIAFAYPTGRYNAISEFLLKKNGVRLTVATSMGTNYIKKYDKESLYKLNRYNIGNQVDSEQLLEWLSEGTL